MVKYLNVKGIIILLICGFTEGRVSCDLFTAINDCTCPGYDSVYECTAIGGIATVWKGTAFNCQSAGNEIVLLHNTNNFSAETCNKGGLSGEIIMAENSIYTSHLVVSVSREMNGSTIVCAYDTGTETSVIGSTVITGIKDPFPPPMNIKLAEGNLTHVSFNWSHVSINCPSVRYYIVASNCGGCPTLTSNNKVTCTGNYRQLINNRQCSFAVQTLVCGEFIGDISYIVNVTMTQSGTWLYTNQLSSLDAICTQGAGALTSAFVPFGATTGTILIMMVFIIVTLIATTIILNKSKQALRIELNLLQSKMKEQPVVYEEIAQLQNSLKSSSPGSTIDVAGNKAYISMSATIGNMGTKISS